MINNDKKREKTTQNNNKSEKQLESHTQETKKNDNNENEEKETNKLLEELEKFKKKNEENEKTIEAWKRKCADLINQSITDRRQAEIAIKNNKKKILEELTFFLDDSEQAIKIIQKDLDFKKKLNLLEGLQNNLGKLEEILRKQGVESIKINLFSDVSDPNFHQILEIEENDSYPEGTILSVLRKGYLIQNLLLRPALIKVSKKKESKKNT